MNRTHTLVRVGALALSLAALLAACVTNHLSARRVDQYRALVGAPTFSTAPIGAAARDEEPFDMSPATPGQALAESKQS